MLKTFAFATVQITWHITKAATINYKLEMKTQHNPGSLGRKAFIVLFSYLIMLLCKKKKKKERERTRASFIPELIEDDKGFMRLVVEHLVAP